MVKGASIKFGSYSETVPKILGILKIGFELKKYDKIVLKPHISRDLNKATSKEFVESVLRFCLENKNPVSEVFIADGSDGDDTTELFEELGYKALAEKYSVSLIDLNQAEEEIISSDDFLKFEEIYYPKLLKESFVISLPRLVEDEETEVQGALANMLGAYPSDFYKGFFTNVKKKIRKWPIKYSIHDIVQCKMPDFAIVDASDRGVLLAGLPLEIDKQSARLLGWDWKDVGYLRLIDKSSEQEQ